MAVDPEIIIALITVVGSVTGAKIVEHFLTRKKVKIDDEKSGEKTLRDEYREEISTLREENKFLDNGIDELKREYYQLRETYQKEELDYRIKIYELELALMKARHEITLVREEADAKNAQLEMYKKEVLCMKDTINGIRERGFDGSD